ncbi:ketopantoate reductase C-terminal domain-containing protein [Streptomyces sp. NPDC006552]|uniref:ketopantoate reductase family protein n=1 Tax=Streptomyces sp. NPDC006552 TaxID=3157179 RepID=UPI0033AB3952
MLRSVLGSEHVVGGVCYISATVAQSGVIRNSGTLQKLVFGEYDGIPSPRVLEFRDACAKSGIEVEVSDRIERTIWEKSVFLVGLSGTTSAVRSTIGPIRADPRTRAFLRDLMDEVVQVARAQGVQMPADYADDRLAFVDQVPAGMTSSMHHDLDRGHRLEVDWLSGDVVERGAKSGVPTPCNRAVADILAVHAGAGMNPRPSRLTWITGFRGFGPVSVPSHRRSGRVHGGHGDRRGSGRSAA